MKTKYFLLVLFPLLYACEKEDPNHTDIVTQVGEKFKVELEANWSTGFHWSWLNRENITIADSLDMEYTIDDPELEGSNGKEIWTFLATATGDETLIFIYLSPGSAGSGEDKTKEISVLIN